MTKKQPPKEDPVPRFIFSGAIVSVYGREETIKEFSENAGQITLRLKDGSNVLYHEDNVKPLQRAPEFLREGAILRVTDPNGRKYGMPPVLDWTVSSFGFFETDDGKIRLDVTLKHGTPPRYRAGPFNPRTMVPVNVKEEKPLALKKTIAVSKPLQFKPKQG